MVHFIELGGIERPVSFSQALAYEYELTTGNSYLRDLRQLFIEIAEVAAGMNTEDVATAASQMSVVKFVDLMHCALRLGARYERRAVDFDAYQVAEWLLGDSKAVSKLVGWLAEANFDPKSDDGEASKKKTVSRPSTPKE